MPRCASWVLCLVLATVACGGEEVPQAPTSGVAGKVLELKGTVTAERSGESRALAVSSEIFVDDVVATGADSTVAIALNHNNAKWTLGANEKQPVRESLAWKAKPQEGGAFGGKGDDTTVTAGRNVENETASTAGTMSAERDGDEEAPEMAKSKREARPAVGGAPPPPPGSGGAPREGLVRPRRRAAPRGSSGSENSESKKGGGGGGTSDKRKGDDATVETGRGYGRGTGVIKKGEKRPTVQLGAPSTSKTGLSRDVVRRFMRRRANAMKFCYERALTKNPDLRGQVTLVMTILKDGKVASASVEGDMKLGLAIGKCMVAQAKRIKFPKAEGETRIKYPFRFNN